MNHTQSLIRAALAGTAVAFCMIGAALFYVSTPLTPVFEPLKTVIVKAPILQKDVSPIKDLPPIEEAFPTAPKKVKSLTLPTEAN